LGVLRNLLAGTCDERGLRSQSRQIREYVLMTWVLEEPIYILVLGLITAAFLGFALMQTGYRSLLHALLAVLALTGGLLLLERMVVTDREQVQAALERIADDVETNDLEAILSHVYSGAPDVYARAKMEFPNYEFSRVKIKDNVEATFEQGAQPPRVRVTFNVVVDVSVRQTGYGETVARFVRVTLVKEDGDWHVADYSHDEPFQGLRLPVD
jgi:hypothetical protein